ncbi:MAG: cellulase family glycosylhydrolase [Victivallaceae bacterium]|nr:cellulase family glycosylhydrolase [Victivallaceae bacterium]
MKTFWIAMTALFLSTAVFAAQLDYNAGICTVGDDGEILLQQKNGEKVIISACIVLPGWRFYHHPNREIQVRQISASEIRLDGKWRIGKDYSPFSGKITTAKGVLHLSFEGTVPKSTKTQNDLSMLVYIRGDSVRHPAGALQIGNTVANFSQTNVWGNGRSVKLAPHGLSFDFGDGVRTFSFWSNPAKQSWNIRSNTDAKTAGDNRIYHAELNISAATVKLTPPANMTAIKQKQYLRLLIPPAEPLFHPEKMIRVLEKKNPTAKEVEAIEDLLDARSRLYWCLDVLNHSEKANSAPRKTLQDAYTALNNMDLASLNRHLELLQQQVQPLLADRPLASLSPYSWIKSFTQWGFMKHPDGMSVYEPNPFCVIWQDGLRLSLCQSPDVAQGWTTTGDPLYRETRFAKRINAAVERSWVDSRWRIDGKTITFSVLLPLIDVDGTDTLELGGFQVFPDKLQFITPNGLSSTIPLQKGVKTASEKVASALMDHSSKEKLVSYAGPGLKAIDPALVARPWLRLSSPSGWNLLLLPGARPVAAGIVNGKFILKLEKKSYVSIVRLPPNLHFREAPQIAEFFAAVAAAPPSVCKETVQNDGTTWTYQHKIRPNAWSLEPRKIAPVPPLATLASQTAAGAKKIKYPSKYGLLEFFDGDQAQARAPENLAALPLLRGINSYQNEAEAIREHTNSGAGWIRLCLARRLPEAEVYRNYEALLDYAAKNNQKFLVDPHNFQYEVSWTGGFSTDADKEQKFLTLWDNLSRIGAKYPKAVAGYDLYNELGVREGAEMKWKQLAGKAATIIQKNHPAAAIYMTGMSGANPNGLFNFQPIAQENLHASFHFYTPHSFTHQKTQTLKPLDPTLFYPGYLPPIDWGAGIHYGGTSVEWFDKWTLGASMLPAFELFAEQKIPLHCGEFAVVGYANRKAPWSAFLWTRDTIDLLEHCRISWNLWNMGFGMRNVHVRDYLHNLWKENPPQR